MLSNASPVCGGGGLCVARIHDVPFDYCKHRASDQVPRIYSTFTSQCCDTNQTHNELLYVYSFVINIFVCSFSFASFRYV